MTSKKWYPSQSMVLKIKLCSGASTSVCGSFFSDTAPTPERGQGGGEKLALEKSPGA